MVTVTITVDPVNDAPVAVADAYNTDEDTLLTIAANGVLANDSDLEGTTLSAVLVDPVSSGTLVLNSDGSFDFTPAANFVGDATFSYKANDSELRFECGDGDHHGGRGERRAGGSGGRLQHRRGHLADDRGQRRARQ